MDCRRHQFCCCRNKSTGSLCLASLELLELCQRHTPGQPAPLSPLYLQPSPPLWLLCRLSSVGTCAQLHSSTEHEAATRLQHTADKFATRTPGTLRWQHWLSVLTGSKGKMEPAVEAAGGLVCASDRAAMQPMHSIPFCNCRQLNNSLLTSSTLHKFVLQRLVLNFVTYR